ncbi:acyl carrier protein [Amycolatopsis pigmentata]|uniref:Acyl carrier protein n=1 Tax=Amycolatopsis pigmentata TaxID=450801 RepID=A0ABW5G219_9PSEU
MFKKIRPLNGPLTRQALRDWLISDLAVRVALAPTEIDPDRAFEEYGLDSRVALQVSGSLARLVDRRLPPGLLYEHQTVNAVTHHLGEKLGLPETTSPA